MLAGRVPCLTCKGRGHWLTSHGRRVTKTEMMKLQGMLPSKFKVVVSNVALGKQLGNTMSVHVIERVLAKLLPVAGFVNQGTITDRWQDGTAFRGMRIAGDSTFMNNDDVAGLLGITNPEAPTIIPMMV